MSFSIKQFITGIGLKPVSADPSNPTQGQLQYADGTVRAEGLWRYDGTAWQQVGSGAGSYDIFFQENLETNTSSNFTSGQNASPDAAGTGTLDGTLADEESSQISGDRSLKYTMGASSDNDFFLNDTDIALDVKQRGNFIGITFYYTYNGDDDDIRFFVLDQDDNELTQSDEYIKSASTATRFSTSVFVPSSDTALRYGFQVVTGNSSKVFIVDDIEFSTNPFVYKNLSEISSVQGEGNGGTSISADNTNIDFTETIDTNGAFDGTTYTVQNNQSIIKLKASAHFTASTNRQLEMYLNGTRYKKISDFVGTDVIQGAYVSSLGEFSAGDAITFRSRVNGGTLLSDARFHYLNIEERWEAEHVVTPAKAVSEYFRPTDMETSNFWDSTGAVDTFNTSLIPLTGSQLIEWNDTTETRLVAKKDVVVDVSALGVSNAGERLRIKDSSGNILAEYRQDSSGYIAFLSQEIKLDAGDYIYFEQSSAASRTGGITISARAANAEFLAAVPMNYFQKKNLASDKTSSQALTDLAFNNLVVGKTYRLLCSMDMDSNTNTTSFSIEMTHDSSIILKVQAEQYSAITEEHVLSNSVIFTATASTITAQFNRSAGTLRAAQTYAILEELNYTKETTRFT